MSIQSPRNLREWQQAVERKLAASKAGTRMAVAHGTDEANTVREEVDNYKELTPAAPVELTFQTSIYIDQNKRRRGKVVADFPDVVFSTNGKSVTVGNYEIVGQDQGVTPLEPFQSMGFSSTSSISIADLNPGSTWKFKVRAFSGSFIKPGLWSEEVQVQVLADTTPPPIPSTPVVTASGGSLSVKWDGLAAGGAAMPGDFDRVEVAFGLTSSPTTKITDFYGADLDVFPKSAYNVPHYFRFRAFDTSGNASGWSAQASGIPAPLVDEDVILATLDGAETTITNVGTAALLAGAVTTAKLADNAVSQAKLQDQVVSLAKLDTAANDKITKGITDAATAQGAANAANTAAGAAQAAADKAQAVVDAIIASGPSLTVNGNFDAPITSPPMGWPSRQLTYVEASASTARSGANILRCAPTSVTVAYAYSDYVATTTGRTYYVEYFIRAKTAPAAADSAMIVGAIISMMDSAGASTAAGVYGPTGSQIPVTSVSTTGWTKVGVTYTVGQANNVKTRFGPRIPQLSTPVQFEVDDFKVVDITEAKAAQDAAAAAQAKADTAFNDAQTALTNAGLAQTSANSKNSNYYTATAPAGTGFKVNDVWFKQVAAGRISPHLWDGDSWEAVTDDAAATAQTTAQEAGATALAMVNISTLPAPATPAAGGGAIWRQVDANNTDRIIAEWVAGNDKVWQQRTLQDTVLGNISAVKITTGTMSAQRMDAAAMRARWLEAGKITAGDMVANTITAASGIIGSLDIGKVTTGKLKGVYIEAKTLRANHLAVTDLTNFAPSMADISMTDVAAGDYGDWDLSGGMTIVSSGLDTSGKRLHVTDNAGVAWARGPWIAVKPGDKLYASARVYRNGVATNTAYLRYEYADSAKVQTTTPTYSGTFTNSGSGARMELVATVPAGGAYARIAMPVLSASPTTGVSTGFYEVFGYKQVPSVVLEDGVVTAEKVATNAVQAKHIVVGDFANLAIGSDFEDAAAIPWTLAASHVRTTGQKKSGTASLALTATTGFPTSLFAKDMRVREGEEWYFKFHAYIDSAFNGTSANSKLRVGKADGTFIDAVPFTGITRSVWTTVPLEMTVTVPAGVTSLKVELCSDNTAGTAYIDDIQIRRVSEASLIQNLGVEKLTASTAGIGQAVIDKLWAEVVRSRKIETDMLVVSGENLVPDPYFLDADQNAYRTVTGGTYVLAADDVSTANILKSSAHSAVAQTMNLMSDTSLIKVYPDDDYHMQLSYRLRGATVAAKTSTLKFQMFQYSPTGAYIRAVTLSTVTKTGITGATWNIMEESYKIPADVAFIRLALQFTNEAATGDLEVKLPRFKRKANAALIVDDSILTRHLVVTEDMTVALLAAHKVEAVEIDTNDLAADTGFIGALTTTLLTADKINAVHIDATGGITAKHTITGATFQTSAAANTGIKIAGGNFRAYNATSGAETFSILGTTGNVTLTGTAQTGTSGNYIKMYGNAQGGIIHMFTGSGAGRGSIWARSGTDDRMSLAYSNLDEPSGTLPVVVLKSTEAYMNYGSRSFRVRNNAGVEELVIDAPGASALVYGNMDFRDGRIQLRYGAGTHLGYIGQAPLSNPSTPDLEVRADAGKIRLVGNVMSLATFNTTTTSAANVFIDSSGNLLRSTSAGRYKLDQKPLMVPEAALDVQLKDWVDKAASERRAALEALPERTEDEQRELDAIDLRRTPGLIAEDLEAAGMEQFVIYGPDGQTEGVMYDRFAFAQIAALERKLGKAMELIGELAERLDA